jgi:hypothetical protein
MSRHGIAFLFALVLLAGVGEPAQAAPITNTWSVTANADNLDYGSNETILWGEEEDGGPYTGSMTIDYPALPNALNDGTTVTAFSMSIGTQSWDLSDNPFVQVTADAAGTITYLFLRVDDDGDHGTPFGNIFEMFVNFPSGSDPFWRAFDSNCSVFSGNRVAQECIQGVGGDAMSVTVVDEAAPVPEPATLMLTSLGLAAVAARRRRSTQRSM